MAKIGLTKLGLKIDTGVSVYKWGEESLEVKKYLPIQQKLEMIGNIIEMAHDMENNYANPVKTKVLLDLEVMYNYTNINFTEKQKEDPAKLYDLLKSSGILGQVKNMLGDEYYSLVQDLLDSQKAVYDYRNSVLGILDTVKTDYSNLNLDASEIQQKLADPENMAFLKDVLTKLG